MADPRTFTLIGEFKDGITPELQKINNQLASLNSSFKNIGGKGARNASRDIGRFSAAVSSLSENLKTQNQVLRSAIDPMRQYRREVGKTVSALKKLDEAGGRSIAIERTNKALQEQIRLMDQLNARSRRAGGGGGYTPPPSGRIPGGGGGGTPRAPRGGGGYASAVAGGIIGNQVSDYITNAIVQGFRIGVSIMEAPFRYFAGALQERIGDELSDIQAAGGLLAVARRQKDPFVKSFNESMRFTQETNARFAQIAAALPGNTQQYVEVGKRLGDTAARIVATDIKKAIQEANVLRAARGEKAIQGEGRRSQQKAIQELLTEMTTQTVLAGMGGGGGAGRTMGAYGLPQLTERMIGQDQVSIAQFQRYAAIFRDPAIQQALERYIPEINKTQRNTVERFKVLNKMYKEILPPEVIRAYERSVEGIRETFKTAFMNPETGLVGMGRKLKGIARAMNQYGQYIKILEDGTEQVVKSAEEATLVDMGVFDLLRDIIANLGVVLGPIATNLTLIYDPMRKIGEALVKAREVTGRFLTSFEFYRNGLTKLMEGLPKGKQAEFAKIDINLRASLAAINNLFRGLGIISKQDFDVNAQQIIAEKFNVSEMMSKFVKTFMSSDLAKQIGEFVGNLIGTILRQVADATKYIAGMAEGGGFGGGFASAFQKAGGFSAIQDIFVSIVQLFIKAIGIAITKMPLVTAGLAGLALLPVIIGAAVTNMVERMLEGAAGPVSGGRGRGARGGGFFGEQRGTRAARLRTMRRARDMGRGAQYAAEPFINYAGTSRVGRGFAKAGRGIGAAARGVGRFVPGGALAAGALDLGMSVSSGENFGKAAIGAFGTVLGGAAGSIFGPAGTVIGSIAGGMLADASSDFILGALDQNKAAQMQLEAARKQVSAASEAAVAKYGEKFGAKLGGVEALSQAMGGGAGVKAYAEEQLRLGKILPEQAQQWSILAGELTAVNSTTDKVKKAQALYDNAVRLNTGKQAEYKRMLDSAKREQESALKRITSNWEQMSATSRTKLLSGADNIKAALDEVAAKIRGVKFEGPAPKGPNKPSPSPAPRSSDTSIDKGPKQVTTPGSLVAPAWKGSLGDAVASELKHKPPGSDLVIANSSETVIPAAGGYGMVNFVETLRSGFSAMVSAFKETQSRQKSSLDKINQTLISNQQQTNSRLSKLETKFTTPTGGLGGGSIGGGVDSFTGIAQRYGLQMTSGYRPGDPGWHGANRARDYSNGTGPTPQMMQFAQFLASNYGASLKELIYTPLGFSIKNGKKVAPYAQASHYNHVHVAYALGMGNGIAFNSLKGAQAWERSMVPGSVKVGSVTANSAEGFGGGTNVVNNITINQQPGQDADELAAIVALKIGEAVSDARAASIFV